MRKANTSLLRQILLGFAASVVVSLVLTACSGSSQVSDNSVPAFTKENFQAEVLSSSQPVLVDFWASWCGPCKMIAPIVAELAIELEGKAKFGKVDVDANKDLAQQYNISAIPALLIFKDGKVVDQIVGVQPKAKIKEALLKFTSDNAAPKPAK